VCFFTYASARTRVPHVRTAPHRASTLCRMGYCARKIDFCERRPM
jgi:hypothetical protein